ncbi:MAG: polyphosphate kinase 1 [Cyclobacteriaceae bacterium]|nr:polyphosphate kinase 1 [Cyclobacteriaceae bacterium HetDA_MAG_MS6]
MQTPLFDRDLSWLSFNYRVLLEAQNPEVPLLERLRFAAIYSSNLDEFFRVRVADIRSIELVDKKKINDQLDLDPSGLLHDIHEEVKRQLEEYGRTLVQILKALKSEGIEILQDPKRFSAAQKASMLHFFKTKILSFLRPVFFEENIEHVFLDNQALYLAITLSNGENTRHAYLNIPSANLPRFMILPSSKEGHFPFVFLDDIVREHLDLVFPGHEIVECKSIKLNKDADLHIEDEYSGDLVEKIEKQISKRNLGRPSRFLYDQTMSEDLLKRLKKAFYLKKADLVAGGRYHNLNDFFQITNPVGKTHLEYAKLEPVNHKEIDSHRSVFEAIDEADRMLHFPYQSYDYVLQFFNEAAIDPSVKEINVTFYRMANDSLIGEALISAARNGKKVVVFMELKARFDEANNLQWAVRMKEAGIRIVYSMPGLKVHAKVALVRKKIGEDKRYYGFFGTGNLNEKTAKIYCDHGLLTANQEMNRELAQVFKFLHKRKKPSAFERLIVSQFGAVEAFQALMDHEIDRAKKGKPAKMILKVNNLEEANMINKIYEAAAAGVDVTLLVRSICCIVPGTHGIRVLRLVDRYLEHARVFYFYRDGQEQVFLGSSDWMTRNLHRRVEVTFPVVDQKLRQQILEIIRLQIADNTKLSELSPAMENSPAASKKVKVNAQLSTYHHVAQWHK